MSEKIVRISKSPDFVGYSVSHIYNLLDPNSQYFDPTFPKPVKIGARARGFRLSELEAWVVSRKALES